MTSRSHTSSDVLTTTSSPPSTQSPSVASSPVDDDRQRTVADETDHCPVIVDRVAQLLLVAPSDDGRLTPGSSSLYSPSSMADDSTCSVDERPAFIGMNGGMGKTKAAGSSGHIDFGPEVCVCACVIVHQSRTCPESFFLTNKAIATMVIRPLDDATCFARSTVADLGIESCTIVHGISHSTVSLCILRCARQRQVFSSRCAAI